jgi:hypothetical protein
VDRAILSERIVRPSRSRPPRTIWPYLGSTVEPISASSIAAAHWRPSRIAQTEATVRLNPQNDLQRIEDLKAIFAELWEAADALVKDRVAVLNRQAIAVSTLINRRFAERLRQIKSQTEAIDKRLKTLRKADPDVSERFDLLMSIPSFAEGTANAPMVEMPSSGVSTTQKPELWSRPGCEQNGEAEACRLRRGSSTMATKKSPGGRPGLVVVHDRDWSGDLQIAR